MTIDGLLQVNWQAIDSRSNVDTAGKQLSHKAQWKISLEAWYAIGIRFRAAMFYASCIQACSNSRKMFPRTITQTIAQKLFAEANP